MRTRTLRERVEQAGIGVILGVAAIWIVVDAAIWLLWMVPPGDPIEARLFWRIPLAVTPVGMIFGPAFALVDGRPGKFFLDALPSRRAASAEAEG
ncbi:MAG: hypothetical protein GY937_23015 [bacterium]|nr:hypothetical protein [bacterium]